MRGLLTLTNTQFEHALNDGDVVAPPATYSLMIAQSAIKNSVLVITSSSKAAEDLANEVKELHNETLEFPAWETLPHERLSPSSDTVAKRILTLNSLKDGNRNWIVIAPIRAVIHKINPQIIEYDPIILRRGQEFDLTKLQEQLILFAYQRTDLVEKRGDFAVRGGILDIFLPDQIHPIRIDFYGDEIEELSFFTISDQRTTEGIDKPIRVLPCRELMINDEIRSTARNYSKNFESELLKKVADGLQPEGIESLIPLLIEELKLLPDFLPANFKTILIEKERILGRISDLLATNEEFREAAWSNAAIGGKAPIEISKMAETFVDWDELSSKIYSQKDFRQFGGPEDYYVDFQAIEALRGDGDKLIEILTNALKERKKIIFSLSSLGMVERYASILRAAALPVELQFPLNSAPNSGYVALTASNYRNGFSNDELLFLTERDATGNQSGTSERLPSKRRKHIDPLTLRSGDYVVHEQYGIGRYLEMTQRSVGGVVREYLVIEYAAARSGQPGDRLFVPTDTLEQVTKYVGGEAPSLNRIGGADWQNTKRRARKAVKQIAAELIQLYAARMSAPGFAFSPDNSWQRELENAFTYVETTDQLSTIEEVKRDMEKAHPMDRVVCGDVGYGKTEIAVRAAFKAVQDMKQVAVLVPTTLLVQQHLNTFTNRYTGFPIRVVGLSRFNTAKETTEILNGLKTGAIDVVIGTHRLLSKDVEFKDLGLVIVDEEQRFGVEHKEELKKTRTNVDFLSMSATPIPRTLEMAITGIREMSNITTPPEERHPVLTYVGIYDEKQIVAAIHRELLRDGQVFFIHNRVESIDGVVGRLQTLIPEARIRFAHGQMGEKQLEEVILAFWQREFDVLVCTTIIESGIDIPNANTLIVDRADSFGLSQLHQLRGRVGRGGLPGLALLLTSAEEGSPALERVRAVASTTDGFKLSEIDLEYRIEGDVLGSSQSGGRSSLRLLRVLRDQELIQKVREKALKLFEADPTLEKHPNLAAALDLADQQRSDFLTKS